MDTMIVEDADLHLRDERHLVQTNQTRYCADLVACEPESFIKSNFLGLSIDYVFWIVNCLYTDSVGNQMLEIHVTFSN